MFKIRTKSVFFSIVVANRRGFLLCDFIGSSPPWNHVQDQGSIRVDKHYVRFQWLQSNFKSWARSGCTWKTLKCCWSNTTLPECSWNLEKEVLQSNHFVHLSNSERRLKSWIYQPCFLVVLNREYLHIVCFQLGTCFLPSIEPTSLLIESMTSPMCHFRVHVCLLFKASLSAKILWW